MTSDPIESDKRELRRLIRARRQALAPAFRAAAAARGCAVLIAQFAAQPPTALASYLALPDELDLTALHTWWLARSPDTVLWLPRVTGVGQLAWHPLRNLRQVTRGAFGISEPDPTQITAAGLPPTATIVVPGVAFTPSGERLGQGGGFYDRVLPTHRGHTIGVGFACQQVAHIPRAAHDCAVAQVIFAD